MALILNSSSNKFWKWSIHCKRLYIYIRFHFEIPKDTIYYRKVFTEYEFLCSYLTDIILNISASEPSSPSTPELSSYFNPASSASLVSFSISYANPADLDAVSGSFGVTCVKVDKEHENKFITPEEIQSCLKAGDKN